MDPTMIRALYECQSECMQIVSDFARDDDPEIILLVGEFAQLAGCLSGMSNLACPAASNLRPVADELTGLSMDLSVLHRAYKTLKTTGKYQGSDTNALMVFPFNAATEIQPITKAVKSVREAFSKFCKLSYAGEDDLLHLTQSMDLCVKMINSFTQANVGFCDVATTPLASRHPACGAQSQQSPSFEKQYRAKWLARSKVKNKQLPNMYKDLPESKEKVAALQAQLDSNQQMVADLEDRLLVAEKEAGVLSKRMIGNKELVRECPMSTKAGGCAALQDKAKKLEEQNKSFKAIIVELQTELFDLQTDKHTVDSAGALMEPEDKLVSLMKQVNFAKTIRTDQRDELATKDKVMSNFWEQLAALKITSREEIQGLVHKRDVILGLADLGDANSTPRESQLYLPRVLGALFQAGVLSEDVIHRCLLKLTADFSNIETKFNFQALRLSQLLQTIGEVLYSSKSGQEKLMVYCQRVELLVDQAIQNEFYTAMHLLSSFTVMIRRADPKDKWWDSEFVKERSALLLQIVTKSIFNEAASNSHSNTGENGQVAAEAALTGATEEPVEALVSSAEEERGKVFSRMVDADAC